MTKIINVFRNQNALSQKVFNRLEDAFGQYQIHLVEEPHPDALLNVCIGGDGAFLRAVHRSNFSQIPFVGINTGHLGFYQEIELEVLDHFVHLWCKGVYRTDRLVVLDAKIKGAKKNHCYKCINEFVIKSKNNTIIHFDIYIGGSYLQTYGGDAIIFSTPSGSTAYNLSAGGAVLYQTLDGYQMTPLAPINSRRYRSMTQPIVLPLTTQVRIKPILDHQKDLMVIYDGMESDAGFMEDIVIGHHGYIQRLVFDDEYYWNNLRDKFL